MATQTERNSETMPTEGGKRPRNREEKGEKEETREKAARTVRRKRPPWRRGGDAYRGEESGRKSGKERASWEDCERGNGSLGIL